MEFIATTAFHPNGRLDEQTARAQLSTHPEFKPGSVIVSMEKKAGRWMAKIHEPKLAGPPPFGNDGPPSPDEDSPTPSEPKKEDGPPKSEGEEKPKSEKSENDNKDDATGEKISLEKVWDLVTQIAQAVGVSPAGGPPGGPGAGPEGPGGLGPHAGPPTPGPMGGPPHDETSPVPGSPDTKQIIHRKAPPGAVQIGAPAFASTQPPTVASFDVEESVPDDFTIKQAKAEIEAQYGQFGYRVKKIVEGRDESGRRTIRAKVSVR